MLSYYDSKGKKKEEKKMWFFFWSVFLKRKTKTKERSISSLSLEKDAVRKDVASRHTQGEIPVNIIPVRKNT